MPPTNEMQHRSFWRVSWHSSVCKTWSVAGYWGYSDGLEQVFKKPHSSYKLTGLAGHGQFWIRYSCVVLLRPVSATWLSLFLRSPGKFKGTLFHRNNKISIDLDLHAISLEELAAKPRIWENLWQDYRITPYINYAYALLWKRTIRQTIDCLWESHTLKFFSIFLLSLFEIRPKDEQFRKKFYSQIRRLSAFSMKMRSKRRSELYFS